MGAGPVLAAGSTAVFQVVDKASNSESRAHVWHERVEGGHGRGGVFRKLTP